jgi:pimeloyl-ACP methyl ester carboxylesterase
VVGHSLGGFTAPLVCARMPVDLLVLVAGMIPSPGETGEEWWVNTGYEQAAREQGEQDASPIAVFLHDVSPDLAVEALKRGRDQAGTPMLEPWPLDAWPNVPTRFLLCRADRMFPAEWMRRVVQERLGITPDEIDGGHAPYLSRPKELADRLEAYRSAVLQAR